MAFSSGDLTKLAAKALAANVISANAEKQWYEASLVNNTVVDAGSVWSQMGELRELSASNIAGCISNAFANPELLEAFGYNESGGIEDSTAVRLTPVTGTKGHDWLLTETYGDFTTTKRNILSPTQIPQDSGRPSSGYSVRLFRGLPSLGNEIITVEGFDGSEVGWFFSAANSLAMFAEDTKPSATEEIYAVGFQYVGKTGGGGGVSGNNIILEDPDGRWRINASAGHHLEFERWDETSEGKFEWKTWFKIGASATSDGIVLTKPYSINVDLNPNALDSEDEDPILRSVFHVANSESSFVYGNAQSQMVMETVRGSELKRVKTVQLEEELEISPLDDTPVLLDNTKTPATGSVKEFAWRGNLNFSDVTDYIRLNAIKLHVKDIISDKTGEVTCPIRVSVESLDGSLIQENISIAGLNAGINGAINLKEGYKEHTYPLNPRFSDKRDTEVVFKITVGKGFGCTLICGSAPASPVSDRPAQVQPQASVKFERVSHVDVLDESNLKTVVHRNTGVIVDNGIHSYHKGWSTHQHQLVGVGEHVTSKHAVLGNYENRTYIAAGSEGLNVLFQDDATRSKFWLQETIDHNLAEVVPTHTKEVTKLIIPLEGVFNSELASAGDWKLVNVEDFEPLLRYEGEKVQSYRVSISSDLVDHRFQENMNIHEFSDHVIKEDWQIHPTARPINPEYISLRLPRKGFTVGKDTPRTITYEFQQPVKLYGHYVNPTDPADPTTGTFIPKMKAEVYRVLEQPVVSGTDLAERVDQVQGQLEWDKATVQGLGSLHIDNAGDLALADEDGEWLIFFDDGGVFSDEDVHQWILTSGIEAYYEPTASIAVDPLDATVRIVSPITVHVPHEAVKNFDVTLVNPLEGSPNFPLTAVSFNFVVRTYNQSCRDLEVNINLPPLTSVRYSFTKRRNGEYSYYATPYNGTLASSETGFGRDPTLLPEHTDPNPPIII